MTTVPLTADAAPAAPVRRSRWWLHLLFVCFFLGPALYGFSAKFYELVALVQGDADGAFAIAPITNYLLASLGFACLFAWAAANGMFRDIERPKLTMLEQEALLEAREAAESQSPRSRNA